MDRLLICGIDGIAGSNIAATLCDRFRVVGLGTDREVEIAGVDCRVVQVAIGNWRHADAVEIVHDFAPHWIIHCGPLACASWDDLAPISLEDETACVDVLARCAVKIGACFTVLATDAVFGPPRLFHDEACPPDSERRIARLAIAFERSLESASALLVRTHAYGWAPTSAFTGWAERLFFDLTTGYGVPAVDRSRWHATPILASDLAELLFVAYQRRLAGLYHIAGAERANRARFASCMRDALGLNQFTARQSIVARDAAPSPARESSLDCRKAVRALQCPMPLLVDGLGRFVAQAGMFRGRLTEPTSLYAA